MPTDDEIGGVLGAYAYGRLPKRDAVAKPRELFADPSPFVEDRFEFEQLVSRLASRIDFLSKEIRALSQSPATDESYKLKEWHKFERSKYAEMGAAADRLEAAWEDFQGGLNRRANKKREDI